MEYGLNGQLSGHHRPEVTNMDSMASADNWLKQPVPMPYLTTTLEVGSEWGIEKKELLASSNIQLSEGQTYTPLNNLLAIILKLNEAFPDQPLALEIGHRLSPTAYGSLGFAMLCSATLEDYLQIMNRYWKLINMSVSSVTITKDDRYCSASLDISPFLIEPLRKIWIEASLSSWKRCFEILRGKHLDECEILLTYPEQKTPNIQRYGAILYDQPANQFRIPVHLLEQPLPMANAIHKKIAIDWCDRDMQALDLVANRPLTQKVREILILGENGYPSLQQVADVLHVSTRTLRRQLTGENTGFKKILEEVRRYDALHLLGNPHYRIQRIAELLGFGDPANFARSFRSWTGHTPSEFRKKLSQQK